MGCGMKHEVSGNITGQLVVTHKVDLYAAKEFFNQFCKDKLGVDATPEQVVECTNDEVQKFVDALEAAAAS